MLDHITLPVSDVARSRAFFTAALAPLGYSVLRAFPMPQGEVVGMGVDPKPDFWLRPATLPIAPTHIAFRAKNRAEVDAFYAAALAAGATDHGAPGPRAQYHPGYYGAFVLDPDGNNIEAVIHDHR